LPERLGLSGPAQGIDPWHCASRDALDISGLRKETVDLLVSTGKLKSVADLFALQEHDLLQLGRFAEVSVRNLISAIQNSRRTELARFLFALGISGVGARSARDLAGHFRPLEAIQAADMDEVLAAPGIGPVVDRSVVEFFQRLATRKNIRLCRERGLELLRADRRWTGPFAEKSRSSRVRWHQCRDQKHKIWCETWAAGQRRRSGGARIWCLLARNLDPSTTKRARWESAFLMSDSSCGP
jgi:NAD-dependent DNA ligase